MFVDAHCHPYDLARFFPEAEDERKHLGILAAASACAIEEYAYNENLAHNAKLAGAAPVFQCYGIHPQLPAAKAIDNRRFTEIDAELALETLFHLAKSGKLDAIGECGFDLYDDTYRETEKIQEQIFAAQIEIALKLDLPVILHVRRAMRKIFNAAKTIAKCKAVIFHSWSGSYEEGKAILQHGVNAYFSFGNTIMLNHKQAMKSCALLPAEKLLTETDAPYQPQRGRAFSQWADLPLIIEAVSSLRSETGNTISAKDLETQIEDNFQNIFIRKRVQYPLHASACEL